MQTKQGYVVTRRKTCFLPVASTNELAAAKEIAFFELFSEAELADVSSQAGRPICGHLIVSVQDRRIFRRLVHKNAMLRRRVIEEGIVAIEMIRRHVQTNCYVASQIYYCLQLKTRKFSNRPAIFARAFNQFD
jgi:hypothetical protein